MKRYCPDCDQLLPTSEFYIAARHKDGSPLYRRVCKLHYNKRRSHPERYEPITPRQAMSRSSKSHRRSAFVRILEGIGK